MSLMLSGLTKVFSGRVRDVVAVSDLNLETETGEIIALLGSSGCGKTSTLRMIAGFESVTAGAITLNGRRIETLPPARRGVAMAFEGYSLYPPLTAEQNIAFSLKAGAHGAGAKVVRDIAEMLELQDFLSQYPSRLSGGQQQRVSLARALVRDADLHLLDEPMGQLEPQLRATLRGRVKGLIKERGLTAVLVTHDQAEANAMADRIAIMEDGRLQQFGTGAELYARPANLFVATFFGEPPMNVISVTVAGEGMVRTVERGTAIAVPPERLPALGTRLLLGVRPRSVRIGEGPLVAEVTSNRWLGDEAHVGLSFESTPLVATSMERMPASVGQLVSFQMSADEVHLFYPETGAVV
jgi:multiple sugar transport system ATP-binding protein